MERHFKLISGILAFLVYFILLGLLINYFNHHKSRKSIHFVEKNSDRIVVSLTDLPKKTTSPRKNPKPKIKSKPKVKPKPKPKPKPKKVPEKKKEVKKTRAKKVEPKTKEEQKKKKKVSIDKLFDNVKEKKPVVKQESKPKKKQEKNKRAQRQDRGIENAYFAKVERMLQNWPAQSDFAGEKIKVWLRIRQDGSFTFRILSASGNESFNSELIQYLKQLQQIGFGRHQNAKPYELDVEFIAKE
ncbi:MAG: hypothetical protein B6D59_06635 [Campylobacteraceae bacterium 4484_4]|nr:MAG: hypothetical protein B6D59_06635 [Campylobacteraceae bacterium 4484_4]